MNCPGIHTLKEEIRINRLKALIRSLNIKQTEIIFHVIRHLKTKTEQLKLFITGGAEVIQCIYQSIIKYVVKGIF